LLSVSYLATQFNIAGKSTAPFLRESGLFSRLVLARGWLREQAADEVDCRSIPLAAGHIFGPVLSHVIFPNFSESFSNSSEDTASKRLKYRQIQELSTTTRYFLNFS
jgi:hypothetical protein